MVKSGNKKFGRTCMLQMVGHRKANLSGACILFIIALIILTTSCSKPEAPAPAEPQTFASPDEAGKALLAAAKSGNQDTILAIFGPQSKEIIDSGDATQNKE